MLLAFTVAVALLRPTLARATLIDMGGFTRDTDSGIDWLDLSETAGLSFDQVASGLGGWMGDRWRHATGSEICDLFARAAFAPETCPSGGPPTINDPNAVDTLVALLGITAVRCVSGGDGGRDLWDDEDATSMNVGLAFYLSHSASSSVAVIRNNQGPFLADITIGSWLVRPIPEPSTGALFFLGLAGLSVLRRGRDF